MQEKDIPEIFNGVDYSDFHPKLKEIFRRDHLKEIGFKKRGLSGVQRYKDNPPSDLTWARIELHTDISFQEVYGKGGAAGHFRRCKDQYKSISQHYKPLIINRFDRLLRLKQ